MHSVSDSPLIKMPSDLPNKTVISARWTRRARPRKPIPLIQPGDKVLVIGASGKSGALVAYAAHKNCRAAAPLWRLCCSPPTVSGCVTVHF